MIMVIVDDDYCNDDYPNNKDGDDRFMRRPGQMHSVEPAVLS